MLLSPGLFVVLVCCTYISSTTSQPLEPANQDDALAKELAKDSDEKYSEKLMSAFAVAASGKNLFKTSENLPEDTMRTAKALVSVFSKPSQWYLMEAIFMDSLNKTALTRWNGTFTTRVQLFCNTMVDQLKRQGFDSNAFEELKKKIELPKPTKTYYWDSLTNLTRESFGEMFLILLDPQVIRLFLVGSFQSISGEEPSKTFPTNEAAVNALKQLACSDTLKSTVDTIFVDTLDEFINDHLKAADESNSLDFPKPDKFMTKVDEKILKNPLLKEEYQIIKNQQQMHLRIDTSQIISFFH